MALTLFPVGKSAGSAAPITRQPDVAGGHCTTLVISGLSGQTSLENSRSKLEQLSNVVHYTAVPQGSVWRTDKNCDFHFDSHLDTCPFIQVPGYQNNFTPGYERPPSSVICQSARARTTSFSATIRTLISIAIDASLEVTYNANPGVSFRRRDQGLTESLHSFKPELSMLTD